MRKFSPKASPLQRAFAKTLTVTTTAVQGPFCNLTPFLKLLNRKVCIGRRVCGDIWQRKYSLISFSCQANTILQIESLNRIFLAFLQNYSTYKRRPKFTVIQVACDMHDASKSLI